MNEKPDSRTRLLADLFHENWAEGPPATAALRAAASARRRRARQRLFLTTGAMAAVLALALTRPASKPAVRPAAAARAAAYEIISDDELLADVSDRPLFATRASDGAREIVVLDDTNP
jgi:hypothetical protein